MVDHPSPAPTLVLYRRNGCHLCDDARETLQGVLKERAQEALPIPLFHEVDIAADDRLEARYGTTIPVLSLDGEELPLATSARAIRSYLVKVLDEDRARV